MLTRRLKILLIAGILLLGFFICWEAPHLWEPVEMGKVDYKKVLNDLESPDSDQRAAALSYLILPHHGGIVRQIRLGIYALRCDEDPDVRSRAALKLGVALNFYKATDDNHHLIVVALSRAMVEVPTLENHCAEGLWVFMTNDRRLPERTVKECLPYWRKAIAQNRSDLVAQVVGDLLTEYGDQSLEEIKDPNKY